MNALPKPLIDWYRTDVLNVSVRFSDARAVAKLRTVWLRRCPVNVLDCGLPSELAMTTKLVVFPGASPTSGTVSQPSTGEHAHVHPYLPAHPTVKQCVRGDFWIPKTTERAAALPSPITPPHTAC